MKKLLVLLTPLLLINPLHGKPEENKQYNVLFIAVDDLNDWEGKWGGYQGAITPNIDVLCQRGVAFQRAYTNAPICSPSRASLFSGKRPSSTGHYGFQFFRDVEANKDVVTLPQYFKNNGYYTSGTGKLFHGNPGGTGGAFGSCDPVSWTEYLPSTENFYASNRMGTVKPEDGVRMGNDHRGNPRYFGPTDLPEEKTRDYGLADTTIEQLQRDFDQPFFIACGFKLPHTPWIAPRKYFDMYDPEDIVLPDVKLDDLDDVPDIIKPWLFTDFFKERCLENPDDWRKLVHAYLASVSFVDAQIGRILTALDNSPYRDNTIVVLWSDHGYHLGEKLHFHKYTLWEESGRVPIMISVPGMEQAGRDCFRTVTLLDLYPTLVDLCGLPPVPHLEGQSLKPLLENPEVAWNHPAITTAGYKNHTVRMERWRYIRYQDGSEELYDHTTDPNEWNNLAGDEAYADIKESLKARLPSVNVETAPGTHLEKYFPHDFKKWAREHSASK